MMNVVFVMVTTVVVQMNAAYHMVIIVLVQMNAAYQMETTHLAGTVQAYQMEIIWKTCVVPVIMTAVMTVFRTALVHGAVMQ